MEISDSNKTDLPLAGGKGQNLLKMQEQGINVPQFTILPASFHYQWLERLGLQKDFLDAFQTDKDADIFREKIETQDWSNEEVEKIVTLYNRISENGQHPVSIRSSGLMEDMKGYSFAGQYESFLNINSKEGVLNAVKSCFLSPLNKSLKKYVSHHGLTSVFKPWMAVIIQRMVPGDISGVLFTYDVQHQKSGYIINAGYGIGEGIVSGKVATDHWIFDTGKQLIEESIKQKSTQLDTSAKKGTQETVVPEGKQNHPCLNEKERQALLAIGNNLANTFAGPQDVEFTVSDGSIYILQSRPITKADQQAEKTIFDNSNIVESYSGVTTPLTYTFIRPAYEQVYRQFYHLMGLNDREVDREAQSFATMVTWIDGRVFYNLNSWFRLLSLLPGYRFNREAMEEMMGVRDRGVFEHIQTPESYEGIKKLTHGFPQIIRLTYYLFRNLFLTGKMVRDFRQIFHETFRELEEIDIENESAVKLAQLFAYLEEKLLKNWKAPIVTDFNAMIFHSMLQRLSDKWLPETQQTLTNDLLVGLGNVESAQPTRLLVAIAEQVRDNPSLETKFRQWETKTLAGIYQADPDFAPIRAQIDQYIDQFGYRCIGELKLEEYTVRDNPAYLFQMVQHFLQSGTTNQGMNKQEQDKRVNAEKAVKKHLSWIKRPLFYWVLNQARKHISNREDLRFNRTRIFGKIRELFRGIGKEMAGQGLIDQKQDVFFLTKSEVLGYADSTTITRDFRKLVSLRKHEHERNQEQMVKDRFETFGAVGKNRDAWVMEPQDLQDAGETLEGVACSPGKTEGEIAVLRSPADPVDVKGKILVAEQTDPGWVPLFPLVKGLLVERGGLLSHSAVVGREMGIPTIVGIKYLTQLLENKDKVAMDGSSGKVTIKGHHSTQ